jgi:hypothetical protein
MGTTKYWFIPFALITVAIPAQATRKSPFSLQLQGPFCADVRAEFSPIYRSLTAGSALTRPFQCLCLFNYDGLYAKDENCQVNRVSSSKMLLKYHRSVTLSFDLTLSIMNYQ